MTITTEFSVGDTVFVHDWNMILKARVRQINFTITRPSMEEEFQEVSITYQITIEGETQKNQYVEGLLFRSKEDIIEGLRKKYLR
jgi:hypothetical protein